eukprot:augustus_masked-scaffold_8-processed-gene-5.62-mRNA-1 protein AED:0.34 eAED:0.34 QI:0/-1/0/1/-1/1/1/0/472
MYMTLVISLTLLGKVSSLSCFQSCFQESSDGCSATGVCENRCGEFLTGNLDNVPFFQSFPGFVVDDSCESACIWVELNVQRVNSNNFTLAYPFGCEENYSPEDIDTDIANNILFSEGANIFSCTEDFCNIPPQETGCNSSLAVEYTSSGDTANDCFIQNSNFQQLRNHPFRITLDTGRIAQNVDFLNRCIELSDEDITDLDFTRINANNPEQELTFTSCDTCRDSSDCTVDDDFVPEVIGPETDTPTFSPTTEPTVSPSTAPTSSPTNHPSASPTQIPTDSPTVSPTNNPTSSPTKKPTDGPTVSPTARPTDEPTISPTSSPSFEDDQTPQITPSPTTNSSDESDDEELLIIVGTVVASSVIILALTILFLARRMSAIKDGHGDVQVATAVASPAMLKPAQVSVETRLTAWTVGQDVSARTNNILNDLEDNEKFEPYTIEESSGKSVEEYEKVAREKEEMESELMLDLDPSL